jgi:ElaB/YqjD/DUF883 family membrane-anchored ribosome-binding protein
METERSARNPEDIQRDIEETRVEIDSTVEEIGERLAPRRLVDEAKDYARETVARGASDVWAGTREMVRRNAVPFTLIGTGVVWYMATRPNENGPYGYGYPSERADRYGRTPEPGGVSRAVHGAAEQVGDVASRGAEQAREIGDRALHRGAELGERAHQQLRQHADRARQRLDDVRYEQPLLLGLVGMAVGALVGGSLPSTRREDELLGETRDQLIETAAEASKEKVEQARRTAAEALHPEESGGQCAPGL